MARQTRIRDAAILSHDQASQDLNATDTPGPTWRDSVIAEVRRLDPSKRLVLEIGPDNVRYNREALHLGRHISQANNEELVRALLICRLHYIFGYEISSIELKTEYEAGRPKRIKPRIDVIVRDKRSSDGQPAFFFTEVKAPECFDSDKTLIEGQLFDLALLEAKNGLVKYLVYYSIDNDLQDRLIIIDHSKYANYEAWQDAGAIT